MFATFLPRWWSLILLGAVHHLGHDTPSSGWPGYRERLELCSLESFIWKYMQILLIKINQQLCLILIILSRDPYIHIIGKITNCVCYEANFSRLCPERSREIIGMMPYSQSDSELKILFFSISDLSSQFRWTRVSNYTLQVSHITYIFVWCKHK